MKKLILIIIALAVWYHFYYIKDAPKTGPGVYAGGGPYQDSTETESFQYKDSVLTKKATFSVTAKVLSAERYYFDRQASVSPLDLVLGWQEMSDESVLADIEISQSKRQYQWKVKNNALSTNEITQNSGNMHLIPASEQIGLQFKEIRNGDLLYINGFLVDVKTRSGWKWKTSFSRSDIGQGSGEIIFVTEIEMIDPNEY